MKKYVLALLVGSFVLGNYATAQREEKIDLQLRAYLAKPQAGNDQLDLFIHGEREAVGRAVGAVGGHVKMSRPGLVSARVPVARVRELANSSAVERFEFSLERGHLMNDSMRVKNRINQVQQGLAPLAQGYDGTGVVLGFIDSGLDLLHPDFRDANDQTRVIRYWDQVPGPNANSPGQFGYGTEWTQDELNGPIIPVEPAGLNGHGTTVAGTGVGNGLANGRHKGVASGADIIIVATNFALPNWRASVADGVAYIIAQAEALGKPAVINASLGSYAGSHDGKDAAALFIEDLLNEQGGRMMVAAGGNSNSAYPYHLRTEVDADTSFTWFTTNLLPPPYNIFEFPNMYFELWADIDDFENVQFAIGADRVTPSLTFRGRTDFHSLQPGITDLIQEDLVSPSGNTLGTVQFLTQQRGDQVQMQVMIASPDTTDYLWRFMTTGSGRYDLWSMTDRTGTSNVIGSVIAAPLGLPFPSPAEYPAMAHYVHPDYFQNMVDSWACLPNVLTVANYCNEVSYIDYAGNPQTVPGVEGDIAAFSSSGPTRDDRIKPDIASTGTLTFTAGPLDAIQWVIDNQNGWKIDPGGMHTRNGGTSMASPVVAGTAALYLQQCPTATALEIVEAVKSNARADGFTGSVPNNRWGSGKLDAFNTMLNLAPLTAPLTSFCEGEGVEISIPEPFTNVLWSNGSSADPLMVTEPGPLSAQMTTATGCRAYTDTLDITVLPVPAVPTATLDGTLLTSSSATFNQWYRDGNPLPGETGQTLEAPGTGTYTVVVTGANGCSSTSASVQVLITGVAERKGEAFALWPSPVQDQLRVQLPASQNGAVLITVLAADGKVVARHRPAVNDAQLVIPVAALAAGIYTLQAESGTERWVTRFVKVP